MEQQQNELASVLNRGRVDVAEKQKKIKELRRKVDELEDSKDAVDRCVEEARTELNSAKEDVDEENKKLHQIVSDVMRLITVLFTSSLLYFFSVFCFLLLLVFR